MGAFIIGYITRAQFARDNFPAFVIRGHKEHKGDTKNTTSDCAKTRDCSKNIRVPPGEIFQIRYSQRFHFVFAQSDVVFFVLLSDLRDLPCSQWQRSPAFQERVTKNSYIKVAEMGPLSPAI